MGSARMKRVVLLAVLVVTVFSVAVPAGARAATLGPSVSSSLPGTGVWAKAMTWIHQVFGFLHTPIGAPASKFGAAHTSDGNAVGVSSTKAIYSF